MTIRIISMARAASVAGAALICGLALAATPANMKAIVQKGTGGPEVLSVQTVPVRDPGEGQVLIKVYAASVNPVDWKMRAGMGNRGGGGPPGGAPGAAPAGGPGGPPGGGAPGAGGPPGGAMAASTDRIPGVDVAGVVEKVGPGVTNVKVGDPVFSMVGRAVQGLNGAYAEYALAPAANVIAKPKSLTYGQAAGLGTASMTGYRVVAQTNVAKGQRVLITGVAGGVGSAAAQIAKARGAYVIGTASARHNGYLKSIGVDQVIDYTKGNFEDQVKDVDVVIDTVGGDTSERSVKTLKKGGTFSSVAGRVADDKCAAAGVTCQGNGPPGTSSGMNEGDMLSAVGRLADEGKLKVNVDKSFPLDKAADAQVYGADGHTEGKIVLDVNAQANKK